jgi:two-component system response regulator (stage 0 sporulation protein A)
MEKKIILVVDDSLVMRLKIEDILNDFPNVDVIQAKDGEEALLMIEKEQPDGMVLDSLMPKLDGYGVMEKLKLTNKHIPVILLTADIQPTTRQKYIDLGVSHVMHKPFGNQDFIKSASTIFQLSSKN